MSSCSKSDTTPPPPPTPVDVCPNLPGVQTDPSLCPNLPPAPTGTVTANSTSISYNTTDTFKFNFINSTDVYIGGTRVGKDSGTYITGKLTGDSTFTVKAVGPGGTANNPSITINVGQDPRINFLTTGTFHWMADLVRPVDSPLVAFVSVPTDQCVKYVFFWSSLTGSPGNPQTTTTCAIPAVVTTYGWYFTGETGFWWHGVSHTFNQTSATEFETYRTGPVLWNGVLITGYYVSKYKKY